MILHLVTFTPRADLARDARRDLAEAFARAMREIPSVRAARVGRRITHGAAYEQAPGRPGFLVEIEFEDLEGLREYLTHPLHEALGRHFRESFAGAAALDFELFDARDVRVLAGDAPRTGSS